VDVQSLAPRLATALPADEPGGVSPPRGAPPEPGEVRSEAEVERFRLLYRENYRRLVGYALRRTANNDEAADVVDESFLIAWRSANGAAITLLSARTSGYPPAYWPSFLSSPNFSHHR